VQDPTLLHQVRVFDGVDVHAFVLVNTSRSFEELGLAELQRDRPAGRMVSIPATELAREHLGRPLPNAALLGGFAAQTEVVSLPSVLTAIRQRFPGEVGEANMRAAEAAYAIVVRACGAKIDA
jgi:pyruvate ferredoxin oxidoreductase gamma subunit